MKTLKIVSLICLLFFLTLVGYVWAQGGNVSIGGYFLRSGASVPASCSGYGLFFKNTATRSLSFCAGGTTYTTLGTGSGTGTVTSIATTSPITGGTITATGTIACATCTTSTAPGAGVAHFAGGTQDQTSSLVVGADITNATIDLTTKVTGILPPANGGAPVISWVNTGSLATANQSGNISNTANKATIQGYWHPFQQSSTKICYEVGTTADNTAATYDFGIYTGSAGGAGTLIANIGPTAGTTATPSANTIVCRNWTQGTVTIPAGRIYIANTTSQAGTAATIFGSAGGGIATNGITTASITAGGTLSALTLPADGNASTVLFSAQIPTYVIP